MEEEDSLNSEAQQKGWRKAFSSHSGTILFAGLIGSGFLIAWAHGGFPSILLPALIILAIAIPVELLGVIHKSAPKKRPERVEPLKAVFLLIVFFLFVAWLGNAGLSSIENPSVADKLFKKVEFPFSEASHVVADSEGSAYIFSQFNCRIQKYNKDGRFQFGWFSGGWKAIEMAIDENDSIYTYAYGLIIRQYDRNGKMTGKVRRADRNGGWWRLKDDFVVWDTNAIQPEERKEYQQVVKGGDLLPSTELRKTGFETADARYYRLTRLWYVFPVVSVERYLSEFERYIMPNPLSLTFTFVFPGFLFYVLALVMVWIFERQAKRLARLKHALVTAVIFIIAAAAVVIGGSVVMCIANALPRSNPMHFWLVPVVVIPYWIAVVITALWAWRRLLGRVNRSGSADSDGGRQDGVPTTDYSKAPAIPLDNEDTNIDKIVRYVRVLLYPFVVLAAVGLVLTLAVHLAIWVGSPFGRYTISLLIGIPVVWLPTVLVFQLVTRGSDQKQSWKVCMRECPLWMKRVSSAFFIYAFISFGFLLFGMYTDIKYGGSGRGLPKFVSLGLSGFCLVSYSQAVCILYSARKILGTT